MRTKKDFNMKTEHIDTYRLDHHLILTHMMLVKKIAHHLMVRLPNSICVDDLVQAGIIGLIEASKNYNPDKGASFSTYAGIRIRGSIIDEMRKGDWAPRSVHRNTRLVAKVVHELEALLGRDPTLSEISTYLNIPIENLDKIMNDSLNTKIISFEDLALSEDIIEPNLEKDKGPHLLVEHLEEKSHVSQLLCQLPERERLVISLYYQEDLNLKEIGKILELSESRVSQILTHTLNLLKEQWQYCFSNASEAFCK